MERLAVSGGWRPLSGFVLKVLIQLAKENLVLSGKIQLKVGEYQIPLNLATRCLFSMVLRQHIAQNSIRVFSISENMSTQTHK